jgi:hypothetical protein
VIEDGELMAVRGMLTAELAALRVQLAAAEQTADQARRQAQAAQDNAEALREAHAAWRTGGRLARAWRAWRGG